MIEAMEIKKMRLKEKLSQARIIDVTSSTYQKMGKRGSAS